MTDFTDIVRSIVRETRNLERGKVRDNIFNKSRVIPGENGKNAPKTFTENDVKHLISDLKHSSGDKESTLTGLKHAFIQDRQNIVNFMKIEGSLHTLVGYLMNHNPYLQMLAAECCCNISLGDQKSCSQLAKSAGPYMLTILQGMNYNLMNYCLLALGNICAGSKKSIKLLKSQGILKVFESTIVIPEVRESTAYALVLYTKGTQNEDDVDLVSIAKAVLPYLEESVNVQWLMYHLSCAEGARNVLMELRGVERLLLKLDSLESVDQSNVQSATCLLRALANLASEPSGQVAMALFEHWELLFETGKRLLDSGYPHLKPELTWLFGNLVNHPEPAVQSLVQQRHTDLIWLGNNL